MKLAKKMLAALLAVSMLLSTASMAAAVETTEALEVRDSSISDLMNAGSLNPLTGNETEPFNAAPDANILMSRENELMLYFSSLTKNSRDGFSIFEKMDQDTSYALGGGTAPGLGLSFVTAVALNATGNPENYYTTLRGGEYISRGTYALGTNGGSTVSEFAYEVETRYSAVYAHGLHFEIEGVVGDDIGIGGFAGLSFQETCGYGDATINASATGGEVANINPENYSATEQKTLNKYGFNWRSALWKKPLMVSADGSPYYDSEGSEFLVPVVGYVVTNVKSPMAAPTGVEAYLSGDGYEVTVDWIPSPDSGGALLGYYIYRSCDGEDPIQVNASLLSPTDSSFVDSTPLKPGKLYTYYVVARYDNGSAKYLTMNSKSSTVVWGIPQLPEYTDRYAGSMIGDGSMSMVMSMAALGIAVVALGLAVASRKKNDLADDK